MAQVVRRHRKIRRTFYGLSMMTFIYAAAAYLVAPEVWRLLEGEDITVADEMITRTTAGIPGDPINIGLVGSQEDVVQAFHRAGWYPADALTLRTAIEIGIDVVLGRPYDDAPVSTLVFEGRPQDLAYEKEIGGSPDQRHHLRLWQTPRLQDGRPLWLGAASKDRGAGISHDTGQITHHIDPDIDAERDLVVSDLKTAGLVEGTSQIQGVGPTTDGRNGGGDRYFTDGMATIAELKPQP
jgi:hypothetical protein